MESEKQYPDMTELFERREERKAQQSICICGQDDHSDLPRMDIVCPKHDREPISLSKSQIKRIMMNTREEDE